MVLTPSTVTGLFSSIVTRICVSFHPPAYAGRGPGPHGRGPGGGGDSDGLAACVALPSEDGDGAERAAGRDDLDAHVSLRADVREALDCVVVGGREGHGSEHLSRRNVRGIAQVGGVAVL